MIHLNNSLAKATAYCMPLTGEGFYSKIVTESNDEGFVDLGTLMDVTFLRHLILM